MITRSFICSYLNQKHTVSCQQQNSLSIAVFSFQSAAWEWIDSTPKFTSIFTNQLTFHMHDKFINKFKKKRKTQTVTENIMKLGVCKQNEFRWLVGLTWTTVDESFFKHLKPSLFWLTNNSQTGKSYRSFKYNKQNDWYPFTRSYESSIQKYFAKYIVLL